VAEGARLESEYTLIAYRGFEILEKRCCGSVKNIMNLTKLGLLRRIYNHYVCSMHLDSSFMSATIHQTQTP
jgi:hypothetical protein